MPEQDPNQVTRTLTETQGVPSRDDILARIVATKRKEVEALRPSGSALEARAAAAPPPRPFRDALEGPDVSVIAEVKRRSPGAGEIRPGLDPAQLAGRYAKAGAAAVSVLTDRDYFGGAIGDLEGVARAVSLPVLRKDFLIHPLQVLEARAAGADAVLLIVRILDDPALLELLRLARGMGLGVLVEVHDRVELDRALTAGAEVVGINNRDLGTFRTRLEVTEELLPHIPAGCVVVSESGIRSRTDVARLGRAGVQAVLVGESLLRAPDPGEAASLLVGCPRSPRDVPQRSRIGNPGGRVEVES